MPAPVSDCLRHVTADAPAILLSEPWLDSMCEGTLPFFTKSERKSMKAFGGRGTCPGCIAGAVFFSFLGFGAAGGLPSSRKSWS